ncbi:MAG: YceI family protein [Bacteroidota bacterium]
MKTPKTAAVISLAILLTYMNQPTAVAQNWSVGEGYSITFNGSGAEGTFGGLEGVIEFDPSNPATAMFNMTVDVSTISTGNKTKDKHARGDSWFDVVQFPKIKFVSSSCRASSEGYTIIGDLEIKGIRQEVTLPFTFVAEQAGGMFKGSFSVNREDYGIKGPFMAFMVGNDFEVSIKVPVTAIASQ